MNAPQEFSIHMFNLGVLKVFNNIKDLSIFLALMFSSLAFGQSSERVDYWYKYDLGLEISILAELDKARRPDDFEAFVKTKNKIDPLVRSIFSGARVRVVFVDRQFRATWSSKGFRESNMKHYQRISSGIKVKSNYSERFSGIYVEPVSQGDSCTIKSRWVYTKKIKDEGEEILVLYVMWDERGAIVDKMLVEYSMEVSDYKYSPIFGDVYMDYRNLYWKLKRSGSSRGEIVSQIPLDFVFLFEKYSGFIYEERYPYLDRSLSESEAEFPSLIYKIIKMCNNDVRVDAESVNYTDLKG